MNEHVTKLLAVGVLLLNASAVGADWYESESEFLAVVAPNFYHETFDDFEWGYPHDGSQTSWDAPGANGFGWTASAPEGLFSSPGAMSTDWVHDTLTVTFTGLDVTAVGGNFAGVDWFGDVIPSSVTVTLSNGEVQVLENPTASSFLGWTSSEPILSIAVSAEGVSENAWPVIDNFYVGQIADGKGDAQFIPIEPLTNVGVEGISGDGSTVVGWGFLGGYRWRLDEGTVLLQGDLESSVARASSSDGTVIVGEGHEEVPGQMMAYMWTDDEPPVGLGLLDGASMSTTRDVSANGSVVVGHCGFGGGMTQGFRWTAEDGMLPIFAPNVKSFAGNISADGSVIAGTMHPPDDPDGPHQAYRWTQEDGAVGLGFFDGQPTFASALSGDGATIAGGTAGWAATFRWTSDEGLVPLTPVPGDETFAVRDVSFDGTVLVGHGFDGDEHNAVIWTVEQGAQRMKDVLIAYGAFGLEGWRLVSCVVAADGRTFAGSGYNAAGERQMWYATLPPVTTPGDLNGDGVVNVSDLLILFDHWGDCADPDDCPADLNGDGVVNVSDLLILFDYWG